MRRMIRGRLTWLCLLILLVSALSPVEALASEGPPPVLFKTTYSSPSKRFSLTVNPSRMHGGGPGTYRVEDAGKLVWEKQLDFTLWDAVVSDEGVAAGYGFTSGWRGFDGETYGDLVIAVLDADGSTKYVDHRERKASEAFHTAPGPVPRGCFLDSHNKRMIVRFGAEEFEDRSERWEAYKLTDGTRSSDLKLDAPPVTSEQTWYMGVDARAIPGTELTLVAWYRSQWTPRQSGIRLSLVDSQAQEVWCLERPTEFDAIEHFIPSLISVLGFLPEPQRMSFSFRSPAEQAAITFSVHRAEEPLGWMVKESARESQIVETDYRSDATQLLSPIALEPRGEITLRSANPDEAGPLNVMAFDFDTDGSVGFVSRTADSPKMFFLLFTREGVLKKSIELELGSDDLPRAVCVSAGLWIVFSCPPGDDGQPKAYSLRVDDGSVTPIEGFQSPHSFSEDVKGEGGRFAVLGDYRDSRAVMFDEAGKELWSLSDPVFSPQDLAINAKGELGVLGGIESSIAVYDAQGALIRQIDLEAKLGRKPNYVAGLEGDGEGWLLYDFGGSPPVYRLDAEGNVLSKFTPRFPDGREFRLSGNVVRSPQGRLWTSDRASLLRLREEGVVDFIIGRKPDAEGLGEVRCITTDTQGNIYAVDESNASVHVFDRTGAFLRRLKPGPRDFRSDSGLGSITIAGDGSIYYQPTTISLSGKGYLKLSADGTRIGFQPGVSGEVCDEWQFRPGTHERLVLGYERAFLVDADGKKVRTIERDANDAWLDQPRECAFAPDGSFIILSRPSGWANRQPPRVTHFNAKGDAVRTFDLPMNFGFPRGVTNGKTIVAMSGSTGVVIDLATGGMQRWDLPESRDAWWTPFASPDGTEVWCFDNSKKKALRFAMP